MSETTLELTPQQKYALQHNGCMPTFTHGLFRENPTLQFNLELAAAFGNESAQKILDATQLLAEVTK